MSEEKKDITNQEGLDELFKVALSGYKEDIAEVTAIIETYKEELDKPMGKMQFGSLYNDSLRLKGQVRERLMKLTNLIKDRVRTKEFMNKGASGGEMFFALTPEKLVDLADGVRQRAKENEENSLEDKDE